MSPARTADRGRVRIVVGVQPALFGEVLAKELEHEPTLVVVGRAGTEDEIYKVVAREAPVVVILDYEGLGLNADATLQRIRRTAPATRILLLASRSGDETVQKVLRAGASGLVGKQREFPLLVRAVRAVAAGEVWANRRTTSAALEDLTEASGASGESHLTQREQEIAEACSQGFRNKEIAARLNISTKTVKGHLKNIFRKVGVDNRLALALRIANPTRARS